MAYLSLLDFANAYGQRAQEVLDFISDEENHRKLAKYLAFQGESDCIDPTALLSIKEERADTTTKIQILLDNGVSLTKKEWEAGQYNKKDVIGIIVPTPCGRIVLGLHQWRERWSVDVLHCIAGKYNEAQAFQVSCGFEATKALVEAQKNEGRTAAKLCWAYGYKGLQWYCPCLLELNAICANKEEINELLELVGGEPLDFNDHYCSSTESSAGNVWQVLFNSDFSGSACKYIVFAVRPVTTY